MLAAYAGNVYAVIVAQSLRGELVVNDFACAAQLAFPIALCFGRARQARDRLLLAVATAVVLETIVRNVSLAILQAPGGLESFTSSSYAFFMQFGASILGLLLALTALAAVTFDTLATYRDAAEQDPLSGLLNRRGFERATAETGGPKGCGAIVLCDIDHFKRVNDSFGHAVGDRVIMCLADLLRARLPANAFAARFGGEEFVAFLPAATLTDAGQFANTIRLAFASIDGSNLGVSGKITASFGVACAARDDGSIHDQIGRADMALYAAKEAGRNRVMMEGEPPCEASMPRIIGGTTI